MLSEPNAETIEIRLFLEAIFARYGYDLRSYSEASMRRRIHGALAKSGLPHLGELQHQILTDAELFARVLDDLTVQTSDMFRDPSFCAAFRSRVVPLLRTYPLLRIWHAGCASGEEAYAFTIMLMEENLYDRAQLYATDLSGIAIEQAKQGVYSQERVATFADNHAKSGGHGDLQSFYTAAYERIAMRDSLRRNVHFFQHDLVSDPTFGEMHVIFCRNVFIYFQHELRERILKKFAHSLRSGGFLCLGHSERLMPGAQSDFTEFSGSECIYRRV